MPWNTTPFAAGNYCHAVEFHAWHTLLVRAFLGALSSISLFHDEERISESFGRGNRYFSLFPNSLKNYVEIWYIQVV